MNILHRRLNNFIAMRKSYCLSSVSSFKEINSSPLNRSSSKNLWSFAKDSRFKDSKIYCDKIYEVSGNLRHKGKGIGYGNKSDFTKDLTCSPGSTRYNLKTIFDSNRDTKRGFSISLSREKIPSKGYIPLEPLRVPAPNKYNNMPIERGSKYTMRMKTKTIDRAMSIESQNDNPGSGAYQNPEALSPRGRYTVSKHLGTGATLFNPKTSKRFFELKKEVPGPGTYRDINTISDQGYYPNSKTIGYGKRLFDKEKRVGDFERKAIKNLIPGPGSYRSPSDFGQYDGNVYTRNQSLYNRTLDTSKLNDTMRSSRRQK